MENLSISMENLSIHCNSLIIRWYEMTCIDVHR